MDILNKIPKPYNSKIGFPWTEGTPLFGISEKLPKISIVTPSFNQGQYIEETIRSVLLQGYPNLEYIIIDGGSTDETVSIIKKYEKWLTYWVSEADKGQSDAINKGLRQATGDVFNWLNSDDVYLPNTLLTVGQHFLDKNVNVLCGREYLWYPNDKKVLTEGTIICTSLEETIAKAHIQQPPTFFRLPIVKQLGSLDTNLHFCMDAELWVNYLINYGLNSVKKVDLKINLFRVHEASKTTNLRNIYFKDRFNILMSILCSLSPIKQSEKLYKTLRTLHLDFHKVYTFNTVINENILMNHAIERIFNFGVQYLPWLTFIRLYFFVLKSNPLGWDWRFYASPLIKIKRLFRPL